MKVDTYVGKIRAFVHKTDDDNSYETFKITTFDDQLISDIDEDPRTDREWLKMEIEQIGLDGVDDQIKDILAKYETDTFVEILADAWFTPEFDEYALLLENIKHRGMNEYQIGVFVLPEYVDFAEDSAV